MLEYARWKYILVAVVLLLALLFALPNFFGEDPALQVARKDHGAISPESARSLEQFLTQHSIHFRNSYVDNGRLMSSTRVPTSPRCRTRHARRRSCARSVCAPCPWGSTCAAGCICSTRWM
jgi:preprotein translocase subunit SecD